MPVLIDKEICKGCGRCLDVCPGNLLAIDKTKGTAVLKYPDECWHCLSCMKACPFGAIELLLPYVVALRGARLTVNYDEHKVEWELHLPDGNTLELKRQTQSEFARKEARANG